MKLERLRKKNDFQNAFRNGKKFFSPLAVGFICPNACESLRLGVLVGKKIAKRATQRNRIRRVVREAFRTLIKENPPQQGLDVVILPKSAAADAFFEELKAAVKKFLIFNF